MWGKIITKQNVPVNSIHTSPPRGYTEWNITPVKTWPCLGMCYRPGAALAFENKMANHCKKQSDSKL